MGKKVLRGTDRLIKVQRVLPFEQIVRGPSGEVRLVLFGLRLELEDGRSLTLVHIPPEIAITIDRLNRGDPPPERQSIFDVLAFNEKFRDVFNDVLDRVVIDELNLENGLYNARAVLKSEGLSLSVKMIPSHAIIMAIILDKPIYVAEELVEFEENSMSGELDLDELFEDDDED